MDFDLDKDIEIFHPLLKKRPEISLQNLKDDLGGYYLPFAKKLIDLKKQRNSPNGIIVGVSAIQGAGKSTQGEIMEILLDHFGHSTISLSIDDHYITHQELSMLREKDPRFIRRGVTHDIALAILNLKSLQKMEDGGAILIAGYDKGAHNGDGDRLNFVDPEKDLEVKASVIGDGLRAVELHYQGKPISMPENMGGIVPFEEKILPESLIDFLKEQSNVTISTKNGEDIKFSGTGEVIIAKKDLPKGWRLVTKKPDFIFYDGWMLGARVVEDESIFDSGLPALETEEARQFAKDVNKKLENYETLWKMIDFLNVLYVPNYQISVEWRDQAEEALRAKGEGMSRQEIVEFVHYFWRSVHPAIQIKNLAEDKAYTDQVVTIKDDHSIEKVL